MSSEFWGLNLEFGDFERLLKQDEFEEEPVSLDVFVKDKKFLGQPPLSDIQQELVKRSTQIYKLPTLIKLHGEQKGLQIWNSTVNEVVAQLGKGSGKDHCSRISFAYAVYLLHCLRDPVEYYNKAPGVYIDLLNLAVNAQQAQNVFFQPLKNLLMRSPYFNEVGFEPRVSELFFYNRPIRCFSGHSESEGWEGYDILLVVLDEIAAFKTDAELKGETRSRHSASQIYNMAKISVVSRFPDMGKVILLSFPRFKNDFIQQKYDLVAKHGPKPCTDQCTDQQQDVEFDAAVVHKTWAIKKATWEVNPTKKREDFEQEFQRNPIESRARFMCEPPEMEDAFFRNPDQVRAAFRGGEDPLDEDGRFKGWFNGRDSFPRFIHVDLGLKRDRAALCMVHCKGFKWVDTIDGRQKLPVIKMDLLRYWEAGFGEEINFASIRQFIFDLNRRFTIAGVWFDKWQSAEMIQTLNSHGIYAEWQAVAKRDYDSLSTAFYDGRIEGYWNDLLVEEELLKLRLLQNQKIDHPATGSKDGADALAGAVHQCMSHADLGSEVEIDIVGADPENTVIHDELDEPDEVPPVIRELSIPLRQKKNPEDLPGELGEWLSDLGMV